MTPQSGQAPPAPLRRLVGRAWERSLAKSMWDDYTVITKMTFGIPLIVLAHCLLPVYLILACIFFVAEKSGALDVIESFLGRIQRAFFK